MAKAQAGPLAQRAVENFLRTPEGRRALQAAVAAQLLDGTSSGAAPLLVAQLKDVCGQPFQAVSQQLRTELDAALKNVPDLTPEAAKQALAQVDALLAQAMESAVVEQARRAASSVVDALAPVASALAQGFAAYGVKWLADAVEGAVLSVVPEPITSAAQNASEQLGEYLPADAAAAIRPGMPGAMKRTGSLAAKQLIGDGDGFEATVHPNRINWKRTEEQ